MKEIAQLKKLLEDLNAGSTLSPALRAEILLLAGSIGEEVANATQVYHGEIVQAVTMGEKITLATEKARSGEAYRLRQEYESWHKIALILSQHDNGSS